MYVISNKIILTILFFLLTNFSFEENKQYYYERTKNIFCSNKIEGCKFKISSQYPLSPKIPTDVPVNALLGSYRYIYLIFNIPEIQIKKFYLMAYDTSNKETIITNGDYYEIECNNNNKYEIRIYKTLRENSFVQFLFLDLPKNFAMEVDIKFELDLNLYCRDIPLSDSNSLNSLNNALILKLIKEVDTKVIELKGCLNKVNAIIDALIDKMFETTINLNYDELMSSEIIFVPPCFIVTVSYNVGLEISKEHFFEPEKYKLSETKVIKGKIDFHSDGLDLLNGNVNLDNTIIKYINLYNKKIKDIIFDFRLEEESYSVTVSTNALLDYLIYTISFFDDVKLGTILYEIEIKIEINNIILEELAKNPQIIYDIDLSNLEQINRIIIRGLIYALVILTAMVTGDIGLLKLPI